MQSDPITEASFVILLFAMIVVVGVELFYYYEKNVLSKKISLLSAITTLFFVVGIYILIYNPSQNQGQNIILGFVLFLMVFANLLALYKEIKSKGERMAEEKKESKGSNLIQLRLSDKTKEALEKLADSTGLALNTYLYHIIAEKIEKNRLDKKD